MSDLFIINDDNWRSVCVPQTVEGEEKGFGLVPRDFEAQPYGSVEGLGAAALPEFTDEEIADRLADQERHKSSLMHMREDYKIRSLDQNGYPYCWGFSTTKAIMYLLARMNHPDAGKDLSGWMLAGVSSGFVKRGGWCDASLKTATEVGICTLEEWPQRGISRSLWNETTKAQAAKRKVTEWADVPSRNNRILASLLLMNIPVMTEYNWWAHSVCAFYLRSWKPFRYDIDNSWTPGWGANGCSTMEGNKATPDNMACPYVPLAR